MRRLVLLCMMLLLPFQWSWAAAAAYCAHETGAASQHFGHHEHVHKAAPGESTKTTKTGGIGDLDPDCDYCHLGAAQWLPARHTLPSPATGPVPVIEEAPRVASHIGSGPERPDRLLAA